jgi:hypothetical protein
MQFCGDIKWNHIIYDVRHGKFVSNKACCILIVIQNKMEIENIIKKQFTKIFTKSDWYFFKITADYYFKTAASLLKSDIKIINSYKLWVRNIQKRLFLGIACELLLKAIYLKNGYYINLPQKNNKFSEKPPYKISKYSNHQFNPKDTYKLNFLIDNLKKVIPTLDNQKTIQGLKIAKVFRNKEGHIVTLTHDFDPNNYIKIEDSIKNIYEVAFNQILQYQISFKKKQKAKFKIKNVTV